MPSTYLQPQRLATYPRYDGPREFISVGERNLAVRDIVRMFDDLVDWGLMSLQERTTYYLALMGHYYHGILPGQQRFTLPGTDVQMYFLPALRVIWDNYVLDNDEIESIRLDWRRGGDGRRNTWSNHNVDWVITARRDGFVVDEIEEVIDFNSIFHDMDRIHDAVWNDWYHGDIPEDSVWFEPNDLSADDLDAVFNLYTLWRRSEGETEDETDTDEE